ncbi:hypothetical protein [Kitasatospora sp. NPDC056184]|uniref:hypothetical protein n=1 Tax=Kitasatospora sp. NPDC056184 TaxID=3345738 RepID=UPI0035E0D96B
MDDFDGETSPRNPVFCTLVNATLDLDREDLGHPGHPGLWSRLLGDRRPVHRRGLYCPDCLATRGVAVWMYVFERQGVRIAAHHNPRHRRYHGESDEQKASKERCRRVAESTGHPAEAEAVGAAGHRTADRDAPPRRGTTGPRPRRDVHRRRPGPPVVEVPLPIARPPIAPLVRDLCTAGRGARCGAAARLYPGGWFCDDHRPGAHPR